jgi:hypothetical protein
MLLVSLSGVSAFADEELPTAGDQTPVIEQEDPTEPTEPADLTESEVGYLRFDLGEDLIFIVEDGIIVEVTTELNFNEAPAEEPEAPAEEPEAPAEEPEAPAEEPIVPAEPYAEYLGLRVTEGIDLLLADNEFEGPVELDIFANEKTADELMIMLEEKFTEQLNLKAVVLDSDSQNAERFLNAAIYRITPGKMNLLEKLGAGLDESEIDYAVWSELSVKEIQSMTNENRARSMKVERKNIKTNNGKSKTKKK